MARGTSISDLEETILQSQQTATPGRATDSVPTPDAPIALVAGSGPCLTDETSDLLRRRLKAAALIFSVALSVAFVWNLFRDVPLMPLRAAILGLVVGGYVLLRSEKALSLKQLRLVEYVLFGSLIVKLVVVQSDMLKGFVHHGCTASVVAVAHLGFSITSVNILLYALLVPTTWRRAAALLFPVACVPYAVILAARTSNDAVAAALDAGEMGLPVLLPFIVAFAAVYGSYVLNSIRTEMFEARRFGQYRLKEHLGTGGMGEVYAAEHVLLKRPCAIKLIQEGRDTDAVVLARFEREVRATAKLTHWNTVDIYDYGHTACGRFYYVMELLPGLSLQDLVDQFGRQPAERVVHFLRQTCGALREAHAMGLIHRDIKPANIFAAKRGGIHDVTKLLDFGLVKTADMSSAEDDPKLTHVGAFCGSPLYTAPEQAVTDGEADARSDLYALGVVGYFLLTAEPPFTGDTPLAVLVAHSRDEVVAPSKIEPSLPPDLEQVILRCLEKDPDRRFQTAEDLEAALSACACADQWTAERAAEWWQVHSTPSPSG